MLGFAITTEGLDELLVKLRVAPTEVRALIHEKLIALTALLEQKVLENLSGKVLQEKSGDLKRSIHRHIVDEEDFAIGFVGPEPETPKAWALEYGGKGYYPIVPSKARMLRFYGKSGDLVLTPYVDHPPAHEYKYLRGALEELAPEIYSTFNSVLDEALR